jgi:dienelactone hydrolase
MKTVVGLLLFIFFTPLVGYSQPSFDPKFKAKEVLYFLKNGKYEAIYNRMDPVMKRIMDEEKIMIFWDVLEMSYGSVQTVGEPSISTRDKLVIAVTAIQFERKKIGVKLVFNQKAEISGLFLVPPTPIYQTPDYVNPFSFYEYKKSFSQAKFSINGMLTVPKKEGKYPLLIIVGGTAVSDRDLSVGPNKIYKDIALGLADNGVAVYRYDKRNLVLGNEGTSSVKDDTKYPANANCQVKDAAKVGAKNNLNTSAKSPSKYTVKEEYLMGLNLAIAQLKLLPEIDSNHIIILGHSESAYLIPYFEKNIERVQSYIALAAPFDYKPIALSDPKLPLTNANYTSSLQSNGPAQGLQTKLPQKILFIQGGRDAHVAMSELDKWKKLAQEQNKLDYTFSVYPKLNHLAIEGEGPAVPTDYEKPGNVPYEVILKMASFILY